DVAGGLGVHTGGVHQVLLHVRGEGVENQRATGGVTEHSNKGCFVITEQCPDAAGVLVFTHFLAGGFLERTTQEQRNQRRQCTDDKRNPPAIGAQIILSEELLQDHHQRHRQQLPANQRHVLER